MWNVIRNIALHAISLFPYEDISDEINELRDDAKKNGVKFSKVCNDPIRNNDNENELCYICEKIKEHICI